MVGIPAWHISGDWFDNCSCAVAGPCTFAEPPDNGYCESVLFWHIRRGHYGDVNLDGLSFVRVGRWEGDLWAGKVKGAGGIFIDERADARQAEALPMIIGARAGGFPSIGRTKAQLTEPPFSAPPAATPRTDNLRQQIRGRDARGHDGERPGHSLAEFPDAARGLREQRMRAEHVIGEELPGGSQLPTPGSTHD